jgi:peptidoglycan hydrolase CwlO-like protein
MDWTIIATILASLGGREFFTWLANRKAYARKENASAKDAELSVHEKQIERYEQRLAQRDAKVDVIYKELRDEQRCNLDLIEKINKLELTIEVLTFHKCEKRGCVDRQPPGDLY